MEAQWLPSTGAVFSNVTIRYNYNSLLPPTFHHAEQAGNLPSYHRDPSDRFLIAQAQTEGLAFVTRDARIPLYGVRAMTA